VNAVSFVIRVRPGLVPEPVRRAFGGRKGRRVKPGKASPGCFVRQGGIEIYDI
jgi:hypothetical protein